MVGLRGSDGVIFAVEKLVTSKLYEPGANKRIFNVDRHIGMAVAGLLADSRAIVENAREEARNYRHQYNQPIPITVGDQREINFALSLIHDHLIFSLSVSQRTCWPLSTRLYIIQCSAALWMQCHVGLLGSP